MRSLRGFVSIAALVVALSAASAQSVQTSTGASAAAPGGFIQQTGSQKFFNVGPASAVTPLPSGSIVVIFNTGTNFADVVLGDISAKVTNANYVINPGTWRAFLVGTNKFLAAVSPGGTVLNIEGGDGFPPNAPGGSPTGGSVLPPPGATVRAGIGAAALGANADITSLNGLTTPLPISEGGTGGNDATSLRNSLGVASNGANADITSLSGLTTPLSVAQGGTGTNTLASLLATIGGAARGANSDITSLTGLTTAIGVTAGGTGSNNASGARTNLSAAALGVNSDITHLTGLTTPLSLAQGGVGASTAAGARNTLLAAMSGANLDITSIGGGLFFAQAFGSCTWNSGGDVGPCINSAIAAAAAAGGGKIRLPGGGPYGVATPIVNNYSNIPLTGSGANLASSISQPPVGLVWNGAATSAAMYTVAPTGASALYGSDIVGVEFNCNNLCGTSVKTVNLSYSNLHFTVANPTTGYGWLNTTANSVNPGSQGNNINVIGYCPSFTNTATCITWDRGAGTSDNTSYNTTVSLLAYYCKGDGIDMGATDNDVFQEVRTFPTNGTCTGLPVVIGGQGYTPPNGVVLNGFARSLVITHAGTPIDIQGATTNGVFANGANTGSASATTVSLTTNATSAALNTVLHFASTTGVLAGDSVNCGAGLTGGVMPNDTVQSLTSTQITLSFYTVLAVSGSQACTFGWGATSTAVGGTYTISYNGSTYSITAPAGGTSNSGVSVVSGHLTFTDFVIPWTGTPVNGDTWTIAVQAQIPNGITTLFTDNDNNIASPYAEFGVKNAYCGRTNLGYLQLCSPNGSHILIGDPYSGATGSNSVNIGAGGSSTTGAFSTNIGGNGNASSGFGSYTFGGNDVAAGNYSMATGFTTKTNGKWSRSGGDLSYDQARIGADVWASGDFATQGDGQTGRYVLLGTGSGSSSFRATADREAVGPTTCIGIPDNSTADFSAIVSERDFTTPGASITWVGWAIHMQRGTGAASTTVSAASLPTPLSSGTTTGATAAATADTSSGCLTLNITPPSANTTDVWHGGGTFISMELQ